MRVRIKLILCVIGTILLSQLIQRVHAAEVPEFKTIVLDDNVGKVCYAVTVADVNKDGKPDPVALSENRLIWFENPSWKPHVILENQLELDHVCLAPHDIDGDGNVDFAVGAGWTKVGTIQWVSRDPENPDGLWKVYPIATEPWTHRMRWGDVLGTGTPQLTVSPLNKTQGEGVRLLAFEIPENPRTDRWQPTVMNNSLNKMHNHWIVKGIGGLPDSTYTASEEGVTVVDRTNGEFKSVKTIRNSPGIKGANPKGAGEIKVGAMKGMNAFFVCVEPFHGNELAAYFARIYDDGKVFMTRSLITDKMKRGHALWLADVDNDGSDEIIIGHSDPGEDDFAKPSISVFDATIKGEEITWKRTILDDQNITSEDLIAYDFNGDGWVDILAGGRASHNVKLYLNQGPAENRKN